jgi:hypothetical protein
MVDTVETSIRKKLLRFFGSRQVRAAQSNDMIVTDLDDLA